MALLQCFRNGAFILIRMVIDLDWRCRIAEGNDGDLAPCAIAGGRNEIVGINIYNLYIVTNPWLVEMKGGGRDEGGLKVF